jgi:predicted kinase
MISGVHAIIFSKDADAVRAFLRDVLELPSVDAGEGWPVFALPPAELAAHPADDAGHHELYLMCDDIEATVNELAGRRVVVTRPISEERWGRLAAIGIPDGGELRLYQPRHPVPPQGAPVTPTPQPEPSTTLMLTCGLPGSGKTTLARRLAAERGAQRFTKDEWVRDLGGDLWDDELRVRLEATLTELAFELLAAGRSCILDFGLWGREERDALRLRARRLGVRVELHYAEVELDESIRRVAQRYADAPETAPDIGAEQMAVWASAFEPPSRAEQRLFDAPPVHRQPRTAAPGP